MKRVLTINEACEYLGYKKSYLYKLTSTGTIPHSKPNGKSIFFSLEKLEQWMMSKEIKTNLEIEADAIRYINSRVHK